MSTLINDLKYAFRLLCKHPGFTAIALVTLAIGIGANAFMFSLVNMMLYRPAQVEDPERLVYCGINCSGPYDGPLGYQMYTQICDDNQAFSDLIALSHGSGSSSWVQDSTIKPMSIRYTSANYFSALGVKPVYGLSKNNPGLDPVSGRCLIGKVVENVDDFLIEFEPGETMRIDQNRQRWEAQTQQRNPC